MTAGKQIAGKTNAVGLMIDEIRAAIIEDRTTATSLATEFYDRIRKEDSEIGAFLTLCEERALKQAGLNAQKAAEAHPLPPVCGGPVGLTTTTRAPPGRPHAGGSLVVEFSPTCD